jgi:predicted metal-dependent enzyme (double-stranded beta helix superfamily)
MCLILSVLAPLLYDDFGSQTLLYTLDAYVDCVCIVFSPYMLSPVFLFLFIDLISLLYEQETYNVYALTLIIIMLHTLSVKKY